MSADTDNLLPLQLAEGQERTIRAHGCAAFPNECCGFLLGRDEPDARRILDLAEAPNDREAAEQYHRFSISPRQFMQATREARRRQMDVVGFYHSHPDAPARPSQYDLDHAWPVYSYVIVSVEAGEAKRMTSWVMRDDRSQFDEQAIVHRP